MNLYLKAIIIILLFLESFWQMLSCGTQDNFQLLRETELNKHWLHTKEHDYTKYHSNWKYDFLNYVMANFFIQLYWTGNYYVIIIQFNNTYLLNLITDCQ